MKINSVTYGNIEKLYQAIALGRNSSTYKCSIGENQRNLLSRVFISFHISDISILEAYMLKIFSNGNTIVLNTELDTNLNTENEKLQNIQNHINTTFNIINAIEEDDDIECKVGMMMLPSTCIKKNMIVTLTDTSLGIIFTTLPEIFFENTFGIKDGEFPQVLPDDKEKLDNACIEAFMTNFYKFMADRMSRIDLLVDSFINENYYKYTEKETSVTLAHVNTPFGIMSFLGKDADNLSDDIINCRKVFSSILNSHRDDSFNNTILFYEISCNFYTFLEMFLNLPISYFNDSEDIKILLSTLDIIIPDIPKYNTRIRNRISELIRDRDSIVVDPDFKLVKYNYILLNTKISFTMKLSLQDISNTLCLFEKSIVEDKIFGNLNSYIVMDMLKIIEDIKTNSKSIYQVISN